MDVEDPVVQFDGVGYGMAEFFLLVESKDVEGFLAENAEKSWVVRAFDSLVDYPVFECQEFGLHFKG